MQQLTCKIVWSEFLFVLERKGLNCAKRSPVTKNYLKFEEVEKSAEKVTTKVLDNKFCTFSCCPLVFRG